MQYIRLEEYGALIGMNGDGWTLVDERGRMDITKRMDINGRQTKVDNDFDRRQL
jgi:hypothetical protein